MARLALLALLALLLTPALSTSALSVQGSTALGGPYASPFAGPAAGTLPSHHPPGDVPVPKASPLSRAPASAPVPFGGTQGDTPPAFPDHFPAAGPQDTPTWTNATGVVGSPPYASLGQAEAFDSTLGSLLLVQPFPSALGPQEATFRFNGTIWVNMTSSLSSSPPPLWGPALTDDPADGYTLLYGGMRLTATGGLIPSNQTWAFRSGAWVNLTASGGPPAVAANAAVMAYDGTDHVVIMFVTCFAGCATAQSWSFNAGTWSKVTTPFVPPARVGGVMGFDARDGYVVLFGGSGVAGPSDLSDTWEYLTDTWTNLTATAGPAPRAGVANGLSYDASASLLLLEEGRRVACGMISCTSIPTQELDGFTRGSWTNLTLSQVQPPPPGGSAFAYDPSLGVSVLSGLPGSAGGGQTWTLKEQPPPISITAPLALPGRIDVGIPVNLSTTVQGGSGGDHLLWWGLPTGCPSVDRLWVVCAPTAAGTYDITVNVTDSAGDRAASLPEVLLVATRPTEGPLQLSRSALTAGTPLTAAVSESGGWGPGAGTFAWPGLPPGCTGSNASQLACSPSRAGSYAIRANYTDLAGVTATSSTLLLVDPAVSIASFTAQPSPNASAGDHLTLVVVASGGTGALTYVYSGLPSGCTGQNLSTLLCTPGRGGTYTVTVNVTDTDGEGRSLTLVLQIVASPPGGPAIGPLTSSGGLLLLLVAAIVLVLAVVVGALFLRRRRAPSRAPDPHPSLTEPGPTATSSAAPDTSPLEGDGSFPGSASAGSSALLGDTAPPWMEGGEVPGTSGATTSYAGSVAAAPAARPTGPSGPAGPPTSPLAPARGDAVCVVCGGQGRIDPTSGKYYCPRCDRRF